MRCKIIIALSLMTVLLCSCGHNLRTLKVDYEVVPVEKYTADASSSCIQSYYSSYQLLEIANMVKSVKYVCLFKKVVLLDINRADLNTDDLVRKYPEYSPVEFICKDEINTDGFKLDNRITDLQILENIKSYSSVLVSDGLTYIPITEEIKELSESAIYKSEFIKSFKELCRLVQ